MTGPRGHQARRLLAPAMALAIMLGGVLWAYPEGLPAWRGAAIVSAWAGSGLLLASLILMVREPRLATALGGLDNTYLWHHRSGTFAYLLLLCHPIALAAAGWSESPQRAWQALSPTTQSWPVWLGWASLLGLMAGLASTFALRLQYRRWRALHLILAPAVAAGLAHVFVLLGEPGPLLVMMPLAAAALAWRLIATDFGLAALPYRVTAVEQRAANMIEATLVPLSTPLRAAPGQFVLAAFGNGPGFHGSSEFHPFTVSDQADDGRLRVAIKALGALTERLQRLPPGTAVRLQGPFGTFLADAGDKPQLWVAGGVGITPFIARLRERPPEVPVTLIYLFRAAKDAAFLAELDAFAATRPNFELVAEATPAPDFDTLLARVDRLAERAVQICGPAAMTAALRAALQQRAIGAHAIHQEHFDFR